MSRTRKCDMCGRTEPDIFCEFTKKRIRKWFRRGCDSQGYYETPLDICTKCWGEIEKSVYQKNHTSVSR